MKQVRLNKSGAVSMLSILIFSLIITIITTAYIVSVISQQKNALSYDQSTRAFYAAESGVQDAVRALRLNPDRLAAEKTSCTPWDPAVPSGTIASGIGTVGYDESYRLQYTCQLASMSSTLKGEVQPGGAKNVTVKLQPRDSTITGPYKIVVRWSPKTTGGATYYPTERTGNQTKLLPKYQKWRHGNDPDKPIHAMLRMGIIAHPNGSFSRSSIQQRVLFLNPVQNNGTDPDPDPTFSYSDVSLDSQQRQLLTDAACYQSDSASIPNDYNGYSCKATINLASGYDLTSQSLYVRLGSVYRATNFSLELVKGTTQIALTNGQAEIDITGKAGNETFRRIQQTVSVGGYVEDSMPDAAVVSAEGICKLFSLTSAYNGFTSECNPLTD